MIKVIISTMIVQMKQSFARPMFRFCLIANPILNTILLYEMYKESGENNYMAYVVLGAGLMGLWGCICFSSAGDINRERYSGTLALIFATPARFSGIILGKIIGNTIMSLLTMVISLITAKVLFRVPLQLGSPVYFFIALFAAITKENRALHELYRNTGNTALRFCFSRICSAFWSQSDQLCLIPYICG